MIIDTRCCVCGFDHPIYPTGCPHAGRTRMPKRPTQLTIEEQHWVQRLAMKVRDDIEARQKQEAEEARARQFAKVRAVIREVLQAHRTAAEEEQNRQHETVREELSGILDGTRWVEGYKSRQQERRLAGRFGPQD
jgi:hypothetical protein